MRNKWILTMGMLITPLLAKPVDLQMGARAYGMGGAFSAIADDATATYWNPAGLGLLTSIAFSETQWLLADVDNVNVNYFDAVFPISNVGTIAGGWLLQHALLEEGNEKIGTKNETNWNEHSFSLAAGRKLWDKLLIFEKTSVGFSLNRHVITAAGDNGAGVGFDLGLLTRFPYGISLAVVARNVATDMMGDKISPEYKIGLGYTWRHPMHRVTIAIDGQTKEEVEYEHEVKPVEDFLGTNHKVFAGLEYTFFYEDFQVSVRGGGNRLVNSERENSVITAGGGIGYSGIYIDYAWQTNTETENSIGMSHRASIELRLNGIMKLIEPKKKAGKQPPADTAKPDSEWEGKSLVLQSESTSEQEKSNK